MIVLYLILVFLGWLNLYAASYDEQHNHIFDFSQKYGKQMIWILAAFLLAMVTLLIDGKFFSQFAWLFYGLSMVLLVLVIFEGKMVSGSRSWFSFGGLQIQPTEFAKTTTGLAIARYLSSININIRKTRTLLVLALIIFLPAGLVLLEHDTGSALVFLSFLLVFYRAGISEKILIFFVALPFLGVLSLVMNKLILVAFVLLVFGFYFLSTRRTLRIIMTISAFFLLTVGYIYSVNYVVDHILKPHQRTRINVLLGKDIDPKGAGYNVNQSMIAIGSGRVTGKGYLQGTQTKYNFVPEQSTDFIFCTVGEEWGFLGSLVVIALFIFLFIRIIMVAERQRSKFSRLFGYSAAALLFFHFTINIGMVLGLIPVIGIPLPFFSYGGSSLWAFTLLLFIFIRQDSYRFELL